MTQSLLDHDREPLTSPARRVLNVAHRGASSSAPENTVPAIRRAAQLGADLVEVDVRRSRDGVLVLLHDPTLARTTDVRRVFPDRGPWLVEDFSYDELVRLDAGSWFSPEHVGVRVATVDEALDSARDAGVGLMLELKTPHLYPEMVVEVAALLRGRRVPGSVEAAGAADQVVVQSHHHHSMQTFKSLEPTVSVGLLGAPAIRRLAAISTWADQINPGHFSVNARYVEAVHRHGMTCNVWTVNRRPAMRRVLDMGVDGVITNRPGALQQVLGRQLTLV
ncbi:glycerophosphodiester phosphodiesterase family protein [Nocardioides sp.]|uniref:glycerophosphodiester phosphodiesterase n=1 Tax=Nocardioides sp. TaxID=35761 RepID=UPI0031FEA990|nr:hypothetical protein [Nocardioides sp.]